MRDVDPLAQGYCPVTEFDKSLFCDGNYYKGACPVGLPLSTFPGLLPFVCLHHLIPNFDGIGFEVFALPTLILLFLPGLGGLDVLGNLRKYIFG